MISISIIMPLYNAEKYLKEALQSVLNQTYKDFELICINDASNDKTLQILRTYQTLDNRIKIMSNNERLGAAESRNKGIEAALGEYITFLDGDDIFEEKMLELAYQTAKKHDVDIVMYEYKHVPSEQVYVKQTVLRSPLFIEKYCNAPFSVKDYMPTEFLNWTTTPWNKLYRKSFIVSNYLSFQTLSSSNDVFFVEMAIFLAEKIIMLNDRRVMVYARDHYETSRISNDRDPMCAYRAVEKIGNELMERKLFDMFSEYYYLLLFAVFRNAIVSTKREEHRIRFYEFLGQGGLKTLLDIDRKCFEKADNYIKNLLMQFEKQEYSAQWYHKTTMLPFYLDKYGENVKKLFQRFEKKGIQSVLWGAGAKGKEFLEFLQTHNLKVTVVVDKDERKQGQLICGYEVKNPEEIWDEAQVILVTSYAVYRELLPIAEGKKIELVNVEEVVGKD